MPSTCGSPRKDLDAEAMGEGETLSRHLYILKALAKRMELNVVKVYAEVVSGESIDARPHDAGTAP